MSYAHAEDAKQAGEGVFAIGDTSTSFQSFGARFHDALGDPGLLNAFMLTLAFATNGGTADAECLSYKTKTIYYLIIKIRRPVHALTYGTVCTILLLMGVEVRTSL